MVTTQALFFIFAACFGAWILKGLARQSKRTSQIVLLWWVLVGMFAASGLLVSNETEWPRLMLVILPTFALVFWICFSQTGHHLALYYSQATLIGSQVFRVLVETFLVFMNEQGFLPRMMTWHGQNYDLLTGLSAPLMVFILTRTPSPKMRWRLIFYWNLFGLALLANVIVRGFLNAPTPWRHFFDDVPNTALMVFPYVYLASIFVAVAVGLHLLSLRKLFADARRAENVRLEAPGSGIPHFQKFYFRSKLMPEISSRWNPQMAIAHYVRESKAILDLVQRIPEDAREVKVLVDPVRGLEDSSRFWSANMILEHLEIVGKGMIKVIEELAQDQTPKTEVDIARFKPPGTQTLSLEDAEKLFANLAARALEADTKNEFFARYPHPWFGPMGVHEWSCLLALHQSIHKRQLVLVLEGLRIGV